MPDEECLEEERQLPSHSQASADGSVLYLPRTYFAVYFVGQDARIILTAKQKG